MISCSDPEAVVRRAFFLAWNACRGPSGMGFLQNNPSASEEEVWQNVCDRGDYPGGPLFKGPGVRPGEACGDYVFGRMMKLRLTWTSEDVCVKDDIPRRDYQAWCAMFGTYEALVRAAIESLAQEKP